MARSVFGRFVGLSATAEDDLARSRSSRESILTLVAALACMGGLIHLGAAVDHFDEFPLYTLVFVLLTVTQMTWAALILRRPSDRLLLCGCGFNLAVLSLWVLSRTVGVPIGPRVWTPESVGVADLTESVGELVVILAAWSVVMAPRLPAARYFSERATPAIVAMLLLTSLFGVGAHAG